MEIHHCKLSWLSWSRVSTYPKTLKPPKTKAGPNTFLLPNSLCSGILINKQRCAKLMPFGTVDTEKILHDLHMLSTLGILTVRKDFSIDAKPYTSLSNPKTPLSPISTVAWSLSPESFLP